MAEIKELFQLVSKPGIQRDGTNLDSDVFCDGQWVRFQRGRPRKMGGFQQITGRLRGPVRQTLVWSRGLMNNLYAFSSGFIEMVSMDKNGLGGYVVDRTPAGFTVNPDHIWSVDTMYDDAAGSKGTIVVAVATNALVNIDDETTKQVYYGLADQTSQFVPITGLSVSGGVVCIDPYLVYFGSDGLVGWSDVNQPQTLSSGDAGFDRVTGAKVVKGLPIRSSSGPAALLWSLDSLIAMQWVGGSAIFRFTTISSQTSILSQNSVIEYDGDYFWAGVDRFLVYSSGRVQELANNSNQNWFFDNLNYEQRQKVWAMKVPRFGEIHWYFPFGDATECTHCVIYNVREKCWYDNANPRAAGFYSQVFTKPVMIDSESDKTYATVTLTVGSGTFSVGDNIVGVTSKVSFTLAETFGSNIFRCVLHDNTQTPTIGEGLSNLTSGGVGTCTDVTLNYSAYVHEKGYNKIVGEEETAIMSFFETADFGFPTGGAQPNQQEGLNRFTRLVRVEPDFNQVGDLTLNVIGREFPNGVDKISDDYVFSRATEKVDMREQRRLIRLRITSNSLDGNYEGGRTLLHLEPGDVRS